ncbi:CUE domain-containing protein 1 [Trichinella nelsoni]|uniref:CUE domain-containing protein 1 n=1 Tax=Trichinella nelsoni TaxID=6336 RepID=A0A0V0SLK5_9BILA|nr:CUE domain-containing protein 1 [Trichinella nelsoni]
MEEPADELKLEFAQSAKAMNDFSAMFPTLNRVTIEAVLRANNGLVDDTIDELLCIISSRELPTSKNLPNSKLDKAASVSQQIELRNQFASSCTIEPHSQIRGNGKKIYRPLMLNPLPSDFLRLSKPSHSSLTKTTTPTPSKQNSLNQNKLQEMLTDNMRRRHSASDAETQRMLEDERIAILLQNQEFVRELRDDTDFMSALNRDAREREERHSALLQEKVSSSRQQANDSSVVHPSVADLLSSPVTEEYGGEPGEMSAFPYTKVVNVQKASEVEFREKLRHMGKASRQYLAEFAHRFQRKHKSASGILGIGTHSRTVLLNEVDESESEDEHNTNSGYNQPSDADYNIGDRRDLKEGHLFSNAKPKR